MSRYLKFYHNLWTRTVLQQKHMKWFVWKLPCVGLWPPQLWLVQMSGWWQRCASSPHPAHCRCRPRPRLQCHPGRKSAGCPCWGSQQTRRTDAPRPGSPGHSLLPPARRDTWWILGVQAGRMDRRIAQEQERRKKDKQSRAVEHYWQEVGRHKVSILWAHAQVATMNATGRWRSTLSTTYYWDLIIETNGWMDES